MTQTQTIAVFITGGTIGMSPSDSGLGVAPDNNFENILARLTPRPDIKVEAHQWADIPSPHMTPEHMLQLALDIDTCLKKDHICGVVILHGTDLLVETSFVLNTVIQSRKPVIATGSMRHLGEAGYDGIRNLQNALIACSDLPENSEVLIQMADWLFSARDAIKVDSLSADSFASQTRGPVGRIAAGSLILNQALNKKANTNLAKIDDISPHVVLITAYPGMDSSFLEMLLDGNVEGVVLEGFGAGNVPPKTETGIQKLIAANIPVILSTRCIRGGVHTIYDYLGGGAHLITMGCISAGTLSGTKALLLLKMALACKISHTELHRIFATPDSFSTT